MQVKKEMVWVCKTMWDKGWVASNDGNVSVKIGKDRFLTTPSGISKGFISVKMILEVNCQGKVLKGDAKYKPSSEFALHSHCYQRRADVRAVVHAHPPFSTAFAITKTPLSAFSLIEAVMAFGEVPVAPYALPGTAEVANSIDPFLPSHDAVLLANHGAVTIGNSLMAAFFRMESLELTAKTLAIARLIGKEQRLSPKQIEEILKQQGSGNGNGQTAGIRERKGKKGEQKGTTGTAVDSG
jgi:L-fuculose-phosphate aldolase